MSELVWTLSRPPGEEKGPAPATLLERYPDGRCHILFEDQIGSFHVTMQPDEVFESRLEALHALLDEAQREVEHAERERGRIIRMIGQELGT